MEEQLRILKMVEEGKITAEQGAELLSAMGEKTIDSCQLPAEQEKKQYDNRMFRVQVDSVDGDKVNVQFPIKAMRKILNATGKIPVVSENLQGIDLEEIMSAVVECLDCQAIGDIVNVEAGDGTVVKIFIS